MGIERGILGGAGRVPAEAEHQGSAAGAGGEDAGSAESGKPPPAPPWPYGRGPAGYFLLAAEYLVFYSVPPVVLATWPRAHVLFPLLALGAGLCLWVLLSDPAFDRRQLWDVRRLGAKLLRVLPIVLAAFAVIGAATAVLAPQSLFGLIRTNPKLWAIIMVVYPLLSVYPQEIIFRAFPFHRYRALFRSHWSMVGASTAAFAFAHILFRNPLAIVLTAIGGFLFARTYDRTRSVPVVAIEHTLYGCFLFTIGLGRFFYTGAVQ